MKFNCDFDNENFKKSFNNYKITWKRTNSDMLVFAKAIISKYLNKKLSIYQLQYYGIEIIN